MLRNTNWNNIYHCSNVDLCYNTFSDQLNYCFNECFPEKLCSRKRFSDKKWFTPGLKVSCMHKNKLYKKWLTTKDSASEAKYKNYRKIYNKMLRAAEMVYYRKQFDNKTNILLSNYGIILIKCIAFLNIVESKAVSQN